jgi:tetratricopeptide (TPR) repeat protein
MANRARNNPGSASSHEVEINPLENLQSKYEQNKKRINTIFTVVLLAVVGFVAYLKLYQEPKETRAASALSYMQTYFQQDSLNLALNGDGQNAGLLKIMQKYSGTKASNLASYYAGICYLKMNDANNAIKYLKQFDAEGTDVAVVAYGSLGDAYMQMGNLSEAISYYNKASKDKNNNLLTPIYLFRAAIAYEQNNQPDKAREYFKRIRDEYPQSTQARETDKYLARLGLVD